MMSFLLLLPTMFVIVVLFVQNQRHRKHLRWYKCRVEYLTQVEKDQYAEILRLRNRGR